MNARELGLRGEREAEEYLTARGCVIEARNYRTRWGEIDLVGRDGETVVFVEVKTRRSVRAGTGAEAVTARKRDSLRAAAASYLQRNGLDGAPLRFDVVEVYPAAGGGRIHHIPHAFGAEGF